MAFDQLLGAPALVLDWLSEDCLQHAVTAAGWCMKVRSVSCLPGRARPDIRDISGASAWKFRGLRAATSFARWGAHMNSSRIVLSGTALALIVWSCSPPVCDPIPSTPQSVCHRADAGAIAPDASFVLEGRTFVQNASCLVTVDGGAINIEVAGTAGCGSTGRNNEVRAADAIVQCTIPPLAAGTYVVNTLSPLTFSVPESADAGIPVCP